MFELSQLRCFVAVAEELHFGRAAARLHMTQPPLSRQVQLLEHALDIVLLERTSRSVRLTPAGRAFLPEARRILQLADGAGLAAKRVARGEAGSIALGCTAAASYSLVPRLIAFANADLPGIDVVLKEMVTADQMEALASGRLDLGLVRQPFDRRLVEAVCVQREPLLLAVPRGHPLAEGPEPSFADLDQQKLAMWSPVQARYFYDLISGLCAAAGAAPQYVQYVSQAHTMLALVSAGLALAVVPEAGRALHFEGVVLRPLHSRRRALAELHLVWWRENTNPALPGFRQAVLDRFAPKGRAR
ncbi:LysR family transcriptional regulator [Rhodovastum atsumiense]|uniref:LysR family transcriptional regulator n=1 Tax=Rhodovastum atsumiense TaxID=504468 RepID=A0A5M6IXJ5_9PROT|nr:LysR family transcriptional regulator [Rhodovastum atsumiense]KAA5612557.1 LysR family transcriptional regulator [Rhodovastum atsumiense]CAH2601358.1 LysR family transcriptional regulator [Rhodovastum atsumiense]